MSREEGLYKDKIEVSLDGRQIFYLFFGGSVIVGLVFVLGVMVGRRVEARGHVERAQTQAAVDPLAALDRLEGSGGLSFQGALRGGETPASDVEKQIGELAKQKEPAAKKSEPKAEAKAEAKKSDEKKSEDKKSDEKKSEDKKSDEKKSEDKRLEAKKSDDKKTDEKKADDKKSEKSDAKRAEAEDKKSEDKKLEEKSEKKSKFTLQLSSFQDKSEAEAYLAQIKSNGFGAYLTEADVDGKTFYRVRLGNYRSLEAANDAKAELEKATRKSASVMKL